MKDINLYINEAKKRFMLTDDDRQELIEIVGFASGNLGETSDHDLYIDFHKTLNEHEVSVLNDLYDVLDNEEGYPKITNRLLDDEEIKLLCNLLQYALDNDIVDLSEILEKISQ